jgi:hypothetical protein
MVYPLPPPCCITKYRYDVDGQVTGRQRLQALRQMSAPTENSKLGAEKP